MIERPKLLWYGRPVTSDDKREAENRHLLIEEPAPDAEPDFIHARAAIFWATKPHFHSAVTQLEAQLVAAVNNGLFVFVVVETAGELKEVTRVFTALHPEGAGDGSYRVRTSGPSSPVQPYEAPQESLMHPVRPGANRSLLIDTPINVDLSNDQRLLLERAFHDCKAIKLELITGGLSGAMTFYVQATLAASNAGPTPMPYFAKLHDSAQLREEMSSYQEYAEHHVAWYLRPDFLPVRCLYGVRQGILVGRFAEGSRSLWDIAVVGQGPSHIRSLFNDTLGILRRDRQVIDAVTHGSVVEPLDAFCKHWRVSSDRVDLARQFSVDVQTPATLWRKLLNLPTQRWLRSPIHGDMHANNVRVRKEDAIVIDFAHATLGPMCADLASLEVWLTFEWMDGLHFDRAEWKQRVECMYRPSDLMHVSWSQDDPVMNHWLPPCLFEIRLLAKDCTLGADEYLRVLAVYLLRHATFPANVRCANDDEFRRAYAYWLANRLVAHLCQAQVPDLEAA